jgi:hypothetical protein
MSTIVSIPLVAYRWEFRCAGRIMGGVVEMPACDGAMEQVTRALLDAVVREMGVTWREIEAGHVFVFTPK